MDYTPFITTFKLAGLTTAILLIIGIPISYLLAFSKWRVKTLFESVFMLPIVLPPTVLGYYIISTLGPESTIGAFFDKYFDVSFVFSFQGILIGSIIFCLPFVISPLTSGFRGIPKNLVESTLLLNKSRWNAIWYVYLPIMKPSIASAVLLSFAHCIGEFGVVLMVGGNLDETRVASIAIYDEMNALNYDTAERYSMILLLISLVLIFALTYFTRRNKSFIV